MTFKNNTKSQALNLCLVAGLFDSAVAPHKPLVVHTDDRPSIPIKVWLGLMPYTLCVWIMVQAVGCFLNFHEIKGLL